MAVMMGSLYEALVKAAADEVDASKAAEEMAGCENRFAKLEADVGLLTWMVGFNVAIVGKLFVVVH